MNGYIAFYRGKQTEVYAATSYEAQQKAAAFFKAKKHYEVHAHLSEVNYGIQNERPVVELCAN